MAKDYSRGTFPVMLGITLFVFQTENRYPCQLAAVTSDLGNLEKAKVIT
jgi:hypothetical protein